jgi:regulatory protein
MAGPSRRETQRDRLERRAAIEDPEVVLDAAARFLEVRSRSVEEVRRHLTAKGYRAELVEVAIARLLAGGILDDEAFARAWIESRDRARPRGEQVLRAELVAKGIDREIVAALLDERREQAPASETDRYGASADLRAAERLLEKRRGALLRVADPRLRAQRAYALLARNGFDPDVCRAVSARLRVEGGRDPGA